MSRTSASGNRRGKRLVSAVSARLPAAPGPSVTWWARQVATAKFAA